MVLKIERVNYKFNPWSFGSQDIILMIYDNLRTPNPSSSYYVNDPTHFYDWNYDLVDINLMKIKENKYVLCIYD